MKLFTLLFTCLSLSLTASGKENPYELFICDYVAFKLYKVDKSGKLSWSHKPVSKVWDFVLTKDKHLIFPIITKKFEVRCMDMQKNIKWSWNYRKEYQEIINITQSNSQLIISGQKPAEAILMNADGEIQKKIKVPANYHSKHGELGNVYTLKNGNFLVQLWGEGSVLEIDETGKEVWRYQVPNDVKSKHKYPVGCVQDVLRLPNGNTLIACGTQARILEVTPDKKIVWQLKKEDHPELNFTNACGLQLLKNGSILVTNFIRGHTGKGAHAFILSKDKKVTWAFTDHKNIKAASRIFAIEK